MVFSSYLFVFLFLPVALILYYATPRRLKNVTLMLASLVFYGWWRPDFILLMLFTALVDYGAAVKIDRARAANKTGKRWLVISMVSNLALLAYFKYANFGIDTLNDLLATFGKSPISWTAIILPVGISFYTFKTMSYTIDVYRGHVRRADNLLDYLCFVTMFPELVAGPIIRYISVEEQLRSRKHTWDKFFEGVVAFQTGLAKKILVADMLASVADAAFASSSRTPAEAWLGVVAYAFQIYFDFSGYSDMAIGLGLMFGFRFPLNFDRPYRSQSITEFWRRWHISLSTWLRDYLYVPLGGNRKGPVRTYINLMLTMLLGGLWHGADWNFIAWGGYQGTWLVVERLNGKRPLWWRAPQPLQVAITFIAVLVGWVLFRSPYLLAARDFLADMFSIQGWLEPLKAVDLRPIHLFIMAAAGVVVWGFPSTQMLLKRLSPAYTLSMQPAFVVALVHMLFEQSIPFLYFQF